MIPKRIRESPFLSFENHYRFMWIRPMDVDTGSKKVLKLTISISRLVFDYDVSQFWPTNVGDPRSVRYA
jgi:hypothetical protein